MLGYPYVYSLALRFDVLGLAFAVVSEDCISLGGLERRS